MSSRGATDAAQVLSTWDSSRGVAGLALARAGNDHRHRFPDQDEVPRQAPMVDVLHVQIHPLVEGNLVAVSRRLPDAGEARPHRKAPPLPRLIQRDFARHGWTRPDDAHIAA